MHDAPPPSPAVQKWSQNIPNAGAATTHWWRRSESGSVNGWLADEDKVLKFRPYTRQMQL